MASYTGYQGYDPERAKVDRSRRLAEMLQEGALDTGPKSFWEGAAQLGKAFIARGAMDRADKAESAYGDAQKQKYAQLAQTLSGTLPGDTPAISSGAKTTFGDTGEATTTPGAMVTPAQASPQRRIFEALAASGQDPLAAYGVAQSMAPKPREYSAVEFGTGGVGAFDPLTGTMNTLVQPTVKPSDEKPPNWQTTIIGNKVVAYNPQDPTQTRDMGPAPPKSESGGAIGGFKTLSPQEAEARGYPKGTVVQVDNRGAEYVRSRPSTAQTGQPTESERAAGLHAQIALNGFRRLTDMEENQGYNRAGVVEQMFGGTFGLEKEKQYDQAADEFIDGYLRAMTGAAATKTEIDTYKKQWFPVWGDTAAVIEQKAKGRLNALQGMKSKAGRSWNHEWDGLIADLAKQIGVDPNQFVGGPVMDYQSPAPSGLSADEQAELEALRAEFGAR